MPSSNPFDFIAMFVFPNEYSQYGLPSSSDLPDIDNVVQTASMMLDEHCGRTDGDGTGSLAYTTYQERLVSQSKERSIYLLPHRPIVALDPPTVGTFAAMTSYLGATGNFFYTGALPSVTYALDGSLSAIIACSGRQTYGRRGSASLSILDTALAVASLGSIGLQTGPPAWMALDNVGCSYDTRTGELWITDGSLYSLPFNEIVVTYTSGFDPTHMPRQIKMATAAIAKNLFTKGGTTALRSMSNSRSGVNAQFKDNIIDDDIEDMIQPFVTVRAY